jgi:drug/metabolite transporter (DMT)-like permease
MPAPLETPHDTASGLVRVTVAGITWGTIPVFYAALGSVAAPVVIFWRVAISGIAMLGIAAFTGDLRALREMPRRKLGAMVLNGVLLAVNWVLFFSGLRYAGVAVGEILGYVGPVFVAALTPLVLGLRFDRRVVLPLVFALGGISVIYLSTVGGPKYGPNVPLGALLATASSVTYSLLILNSKRLLEGASTVSLMLTEYVTGSVLLLPAALLLPGPHTSSEWGAVAVLAIVLTVLTGLLFVSGLRRVRADHAAILTYGEPVSAVVFGALLLHQPLTAAVVAGGAAVVAAGVLVARMHIGFGQEAPPPESAEDDGLPSEAG